ncbi:dehydrase and lipid transport-domain-containing protein [Blastocladiella britannica]|nr:dehydrase and lipid transport-domain-containing protein [Blastocladiella britannica]
MPPLLSASSSSSSTSRLLLLLARGSRAGVSGGRSLYTPRVPAPPAMPTSPRLSATKPKPSQSSSLSTSPLAAVSRFMGFADPFMSLRPTTSSSSSWSSPSPSKSPRPVEHAERKLLRHAPAQLYAMVSNVDEYRRFVPYCTASVVHDARRMSAGMPPHLPAMLRSAPLAVRRAVSDASVPVTAPVVAASQPVTVVPSKAPPAAEVFQMMASLDVGFSGLSESYTSRVTCVDQSLVLAEASNTSLFSSLITVWHFAPGPTPGSSMVDFYLQFTFRSGLHARLASLFFDTVAQQTMAAFERRAAELYEGGSTGHRLLSSSTTGARHPLDKARQPVVALADSVASAATATATDAAAPSSAAASVGTGTIPPPTLPGAKV